MPARSSSGSRVMMIRDDVVVGRAVRKNQGPPQRDDRHVVAWSGDDNDNDDSLRGDRRRLRGPRDPAPEDATAHRAESRAIARAAEVAETVVAGRHFDRVVALTALGGPLGTLAFVAAPSSPGARPRSAEIVGGRLRPGSGGWKDLAEVRRSVGEGRATGVTFAMASADPLQRRRRPTVLEWTPRGARQVVDVDLDPPALPGELEIATTLMVDVCRWPLHLVRESVEAVRPPALARARPSEAPSPRERAEPPGAGMPSAIGVAFAVAVVCIRFALLFG